MEIRSHKEFLSQASIILAFIVILQSAGPWFLWGKAVVGYVAIILFLCFRVMLERKISSRFVAFAFSLFAFYVWIGIYHAEHLQNLAIVLVKYCLPFFCILTMRTEECYRLKTITINVFSLILAISLVAYLIWLCGYSFPAVKINHPSNTWYPPFLNYYFFITEYRLGEFLRFRSVFTEPGHLGMYCAFFLYINGYVLKKAQNIIFLLSLVFSLSLAAYILLFAGWLLYNLMSGVSLNRICRILLIICLFAGMGWLYMYKSKNEVIQTLIINRLAYDSEKGVKGNNRNTYDFRRTYEQLSGSEYLVGKGTSFMKDHFNNTANSSYKNYVLMYGIIGMLIIFLCFLSAVFVFPSRLGLGLFFLYVISFIQRPYWLWEVESWVYLCAVPLFYYRRKN